MQNTQRLAEQSLGLPSEPLQAVSSRPLGNDAHLESPPQEMVSSPMNIADINGRVSPPIISNSLVAPIIPAGEKSAETAANGYVQASETRDFGP